MTLAARRKRDAAGFRRVLDAYPDDPTPTPEIAVIDATVIDEPQNSDEALAQAVEYAQPGDRVAIHAVDCPTRRDSAWGCKCEPVTAEVGAEA